MTDDINTEQAPTAPVVKAKIIRGRMSLPLVWYVRYNLLMSPLKDSKGDMVDMTDSAAAAIMFTTAGKINDIRKGANFSYINEDSTFNQADIDQAKAILMVNVDKCEDFNETDVVELIDVLDTMVSEASTVASDRASYLEKNPRKVKEPKADEDTAEVISESDTAEVISESEDELDLL